MHWRQVSAGPFNSDVQAARPGSRSEPPKRKQRREHKRLGSAACVRGAVFVSVQAGAAGRWSRLERGFLRGFAFFAAFALPDARQ
jgi:hypothetical protein